MGKVEGRVIKSTLALVPMMLSWGSDTPRLPAWQDWSGYREKFLAPLLAMCTELTIWQLDIRGEGLVLDAVREKLAQVTSENTHGGLVCASPSACADDELAPVIFGGMPHRESFPGEDPSAVGYRATKVLIFESAQFRTAASAISYIPLITQGPVCLTLGWKERDRYIKEHVKRGRWALLLSASQYQLWCPGSLRDEVASLESFITERWRCDSIRSGDAWHPELYGK